MKIGQRFWAKVWSWFLNLSSVKILKLNYDVTYILRWKQSVIGSRGLLCLWQYLSFFLRLIDWCTQNGITLRKEIVKCFLLSICQGQKFCHKIHMEKFQGLLPDQFIAMVNGIYLLLICLGFYQGATQAVVWQYNRDLRFIWHFDGLVDGPRPRHPIPPCFLYFVERRKVIFTQDAFSLHILKRWEVLVQKMICGKSVFVFLTCYACCGKDNHITIVFSSQTWQHHWWSPK